MHTHMQIGRLTRHTRQQVPDLRRRPRGASTSRGLIMLVLPTPAAGRGTGCRRPPQHPSTPQQVTPGKRTGRYWPGSLHPPYSNEVGGWHRAVGE